MAFISKILYFGSALHYKWRMRMCKCGVTTRRVDNRISGPSALSHAMRHVMRRQVPISAVYNSRSLNRPLSFARCCVHSHSPPDLSSYVL